MCVCVSVKWECIITRWIISPAFSWFNDSGTEPFPRSAPCGLCRATGTMLRKNVSGSGTVVESLKLGPAALGSEEFIVVVGLGANGWLEADDLEGRMSWGGSRFGWEIESGGAD